MGRYKAPIIYGVGIVLSVFGLSMFAWWPDMIQGLVNGKLALTGTDSEMYDVWLNPTDPTDKTKWGIGGNVSFHLRAFNITNPDEVANGSKPKLQEVGPYYYQIKMWKENPKWNDDQTEVSFEYHETYEFDLERSGGRDPTKDEIHHLNPAVFATLSKLKGQVPKWEYDAACTILKSFPEETTTVRHSVHELVWGYNDSFLQFMQDLQPKLVPTHLVAIFENDPKTFYQGPSTLYTGKGNSSRYMNFRRWGGYDAMDWWATDEANRFKGTDASQFPANIKSGDKIMTFVDDLYRSVQLKDSGVTFDYSGVSLMRFVVDPDEYATDMSNSRGYYQFGAPGVFNITNVPIEPAYNSPTFVSQPYFHDASPSYRNDVEFVSPIPSEDDIELRINVEPTLGATLLAQKRYQVNMRAIQAPECASAAGRVQPILFPMVWAEEHFEPSPELLGQIKDSLSQRTTGRTVGYVLASVFLVVGVVMFFGGLLLEKKLQAQAEEEAEPLNPAASAVNARETQW